MKVLVVNSNVLLKRKIFEKLRETILRDCEKYKTVMLPHGFTYEIVDVDAVQVNDNFRLLKKER